MSDKHKSASREAELTPRAPRRPVGVERGVRGRSDDGRAFIPDPQQGGAHANESLAEALAEEYLLSATTGQEMSEEARDEESEEEIGGPFIETRASTEFAMGFDEENPPDAEPAAFPVPMRSAE